MDGVLVIYFLLFKVMVFLYPFRELCGHRCNNEQLHPPIVAKAKILKYIFILLKKYYSQNLLVVLIYS